MRHLGAFHPGLGPEIQLQTKPLCPRLLTGPQMTLLLPLRVALALNFFLALKWAKGEAWPRGLSNVF